MNQHPPAPTDELSAKALDRIETMESPDYVFPERFSRASWVAALVVIGAMFVWLVAAASM